MSVNKEKNGSWTLQYYENRWDGTRVHKKKRGFKTKREALEWKKENTGLASALDLTLEDFTEIYFNNKKNELKERTILMKKDVIKAHIIPYFGRKQMNDIKASDVINWKNCIMDKGYSDAYLRLIQNQLTALFTHACKVYDLPEAKNPCKKVPKMGNYDPKKLNFWTREEYELFLKQLEPDSRFYVIFETLYWTGMREGELLALTMGDIDVVNHQINIDKTYYRRNGEDMITPPKTKNSIRTIDVPEFLIIELKEYMDRIYDLKDDDRIFPIVAEAIQHKLRREIAKGGLKKIRVHDFRHSHCADLVNQHIEPLVIKERLGHKDIKITLNTYGHLYPSRQKDVAQMLNQQRSR